MPQEKNTMTPEQFATAASATRLKPRAIAVAEAVLVGGKGLTQAGNASIPRMQRQQVADAVARIEREHLYAIGAPRGWRCITLVLPWYGEEWEAAELLQKQAFERLSRKKPSIEEIEK
jgi:hypothetical protein